MKVGVIGVGGRTGTMFAFELKERAQVISVGREEEVELIKTKNLFLERNNQKILFEGKIIKDSDFPDNEFFDALFFTTKNPIGATVKYYYQKIKEKKLKIPALFLSQNGIEAGEEAKEVLNEIFPGESEKIAIFRISLFNPVSKRIVEKKHYIEYSPPIRLAIAQISGEEKKEFFEIFDKKTFEVYKISKENAKNMEYSKLFLNLIGTASASYNLSLKEGLEKKEIFSEEVELLKEFIKTIKASGGKFLNFPHYPVKFLSLAISYLPSSFFLLFRKFFIKVIEKERGGKEKNLDEIDYYNGAVVKIGKRLNIPTPTNENIIKRVKK